MDFQEQDQTPNEDYPFISNQASSMLEGSARFQDAYVFLRLYNEAYEHYLDTYTDYDGTDEEKKMAHGFASFMINKLYPNRG